MAQEATDCPGRRHSRIVAQLSTRLLGTLVDGDGDGDADERCSLSETPSFNLRVLAQGDAEVEKHRTTTPVPNLVRTASPGATFMVAMVMVRRRRRRRMEVTGDGRCSVRPPARVAGSRKSANSHIRIVLIPL